MATAAWAKAPAHLWIVGLVSLLWTAFGVFDYVMTETQNDWYLGQLWGFNHDDRAYFLSFPAAQVAGWAIGVWAALLGSILLLLRNGFAAWAFVASFVGSAVGILVQFVISPHPTYQPSGPMVAMSFVYLLIILGLVVYAWRMRSTGVLR